MSTYYPNRPDNLEDVCFHDFIANWEGKDKNGNRIYRKLTKSRLVNHRIFDPKKKNERQEYFYSLIVLFVPFRDESSLLKEGETPEEAFHRLLPHTDDPTAYHAYHERLQAILDTQANVREINEARKAEAVQNEVNIEEE